MRRLSPPLLLSLFFCLSGQYTGYIPCTCLSLKSLVDCFLFVFFLFPSFSRLFPGASFYQLFLFDPCRVSLHFYFASRLSNQAVGVSDNVQCSQPLFQNAIGQKGQQPLQDRQAFILFASFLKCSFLLCLKFLCI